MDKNTLTRICSHIDALKEAESSEELKVLDQRLRSELSDELSEADDLLLSKLFELASQLVTTKEKLLKSEKSLPVLSAQETNENELVQRLLDMDTRTSPDKECVYPLSGINVMSKQYGCI